MVRPFFFNGSKKLERNGIRTRFLEQAMGDGIKKIEINEKETSVLQRRAIRCLKNLTKAIQLKKEDIEFQRPCQKMHSLQTR